MKKKEAIWWLDRMFVDEGGLCSGVGWQTRSGKCGDEQFYVVCPGQRGARRLETVWFRSPAWSNRESGWVGPSLKKAIVAAGESVLESVLAWNREDWLVALRTVSQLGDPLFDEPGVNQLLDQIRERCMALTGFMPDSYLEG